MVRIRMKRLGRRHRPFYRINAVELKTKRDGKVLEELGWYNPLEKDQSKQVHIEEERVRHWLSMGAQPSDSVMDMLAKRNIVDAEKWKAARAARVERKIAARNAAAAPAGEAAAPAAS